MILSCDAGEDRIFQNVPGTRRQGLEASLQYKSAQWLVYAGYSLVDATYRSLGARSNGSGTWV